MKSLLSFLCLCIISSQIAVALEPAVWLQQSALETVHWKPPGGPWPQYLPRGYRFQGVSYINTKQNKITHLRFTKGKKLISIFSKPRTGKRRKWRVRRRGKYTIVEWQRGGKDLALIGQEKTGCLMKIAESIK